MKSKRSKISLKIPKTVLINGKSWRIKKSKTILAREGLDGFCVPCDRRITISMCQDDLQRELTFVHELLHAIWPSGIVADSTEERIIQSLEVGLHSILTANKLQGK